MLDATKTGQKVAKRIIDVNAPAEIQQKITELWQGIISDIFTDLINDSQITVLAGIAVATAGSATSQTGATTSTGTAKIQ